eukprot:PITA_03066
MEDLISGSQTERKRYTQVPLNQVAYTRGFDDQKAQVWDIVEAGYKFPSATPIDSTGKKQYETNAKVVNTLLGSLSQAEFVKVMQLKTAKQIWDKIVLSYEGDDQVKRAKLQNLRIQYENLRIHNDESVANYFLRIDEIVNRMKNLGEEIKEVTLVEKVLNLCLLSLNQKFLP